MELKVNEVVIPEGITFNYEELKKELTEKVHIYETMVYTDEQLKDAKVDRANLNKLKKALNDERIRREKEYMQPFNEFKDKIKELISIIDKPVAMIDKQVKEFEDKKKAEKRVEIGSLWMNIEDKPEWLVLTAIFDERWLNAGYSLKQIKEDLEAWVRRINAEVEALKELPECSYEAVEEYKRGLDMSKAIAEAKRQALIQKEKLEKAAEATETAEQTIKPAEEGPKSWINFSANLTVSQALELKEFFNKRNIEFKRI